MSKRLYKSGSHWAIWRWTFTPSGYLTRLFLLHTPFGGVMFHWINGPDPEPDPHNHPVSFLSLILWGWYLELSRDYMSIYSNDGWIYKLTEIRRFNYVRAETHVHRIIEVAPNTLTLVFYGPKKCTWGFFTKTGWIAWQDYNKKYNWKTIPPSVEEVCEAFDEMTRKR